MYRHLSRPRPDWRRTVVSQGLTFPTSKHPDGSESPYWWENAMYEFSEAEVEHLETVTEKLDRLCLEAARFLVTGAMGDLGLTREILQAAAANLASNPPSLYGRFDLRYDGLGPAKLLEYNADTPTGLIESSVIQWYWLMDKMPNSDQFNSIHERLVRQWSRITPKLRSRTVHFAHHDHDNAYEEWMTIAYILDTAKEAGLNVVGLTISDIGWDNRRDEFVDLTGARMDNVFKLYPWENMLRESFGRYVLSDPDAVRWIEPMWKVVLSNKALLAALWHLYPDDDNLLPAYLDSPQGLREWVAKPLFGREGSSIRIHADDVEEVHDGPYGAEGYCYQQWAPLPDFDGNRTVIGSWCIGGKAAGIGVRESDGWITDFYARFVPHVIDAPQPPEDVKAAWLDEN